MPIIRQETVFNGIVVSSYKSDYYDDFKVQFRAKHNCRKCHGRGKHQFDNPSRGTRWTETCSCVHLRDK